MVRKKVALLVSLCLIVSVFPTVANASEVEKKAEVLNKVNVLMGDGINYNLDGNLKRSEAAAFIVRLLGVENDVKESKEKYSKTEFSDIEEDQWYAMYIGYVAENNIVNGYGDGTYKPNEYISEKQFTKMVLGALGYVQGVDFSWDEVYSFAYAKELYTDDAYLTKVEDKEDYKRHKVIELLYISLTKEMKEKRQTIIERLVASDMTSEQTAIKLGLIQKDTIELVIESAKAVSGTEIEIVFNEELENNQEPIISISRSNNKTKKLEVSKMKIDKDKIVLTTEVQSTNLDYKVSITELKDAEGNSSDIEVGIKGYKALAITSDYFLVSKVEAVSENIINVFFTHPITINTEYPTNYKIYKDEKVWVDGGFSTLTVKKLSAVDNAISIYIKGNKDMFDSQIYKLKLSSNIVSIYGTKLNEGKGEEVEFIGNGNANSKLSLDKITALDNKTLYVEFDNEVDKSSAENISNYSIKQGNTTINLLKVTKVQGMNAVKIGVFQTLEDSKIYKLTIDGVTDAFKKNSISNQEVEFVGSSIENIPNSIIFVGAMDSHTLSVYFDKAPYATNGGNKAYYTVSGPGFTGLPQAVSYDVKNSPNMAILHMATALKENNEYTLTVNTSIKNEVLQSPPSELAYKFMTIDAKNQKPRFDHALYIGTNTVLVTMSEPVQISGGNLIQSNYKLKYKEEDKEKLVACSSVSAISPTKFILVFDSFDTNTIYSLEFANLVDYAGIDIATSADVNTIDVEFGVK